ncbi:MAG: hypothetical protein CMK07_16840 [Ponticaulis sp.]|nr:hypothetical protein [Ponticaulis sp.]
MRHFLLIAFAGLVLAGCGTSRMNQPTETFVGIEPDETMVAEAIRGALQEQRWKIVSDNPGKIVASYSRRSDWFVVIEIPYNGDSYQLLYADSRNLDYSERSGRIHERYNVWIEELNNEISVRIYGLEN